jgi:hypothetical protein
MPGESKSRGQGRGKLSALVDSGSAPGFQPVTFAGTSIYVHKLALKPLNRTTRSPSHAFRPRSLEILVSPPYLVTRQSTISACNSLTDCRVTVTIVKQGGVNYPLVVVVVVVVPGTEERYYRYCCLCMCVARFLASSFCSRLLFLAPRSRFRFLFSQRKLLHLGANQKKIPHFLPVSQVVFGWVSQIHSNALCGLSFSG